MSRTQLYFSRESSTRKVGVIKTACSYCNGPLEEHRIGKQRYCLACHAMFMRLTRPKHSELKPEAKMKANARAKSRYLVKKGVIEKKACEKCGSPDTERHHDDYNKPNEVRWLCRPCHLGWHRVENGKVI